MDIDVFAKDQLPIVFRVLRMALDPDRALDATECRFLDTYARITGHLPLPGDPPRLAATDVRLSGAHRRKRLVQLAALAVLLGRPVKESSFAYLRALAAHLETHDPVIEAIEALREGRHLKVRMLSMRRGMRVLLKEAYTAEGWIGVPRFLGALLFGATVNKDQHLRYKRLGLLPEGTLGREYWKHMTELGYGFPGEPNGIASSIAYHDVAHVLAGHLTDGPGEILQGSFQGGNRREDGFFFIQFVLLHFHQGVQITPAAAPEKGLFDPELVLWAIHRGATCKVDMTHQWDYWPLMALPLPEARARCGLITNPAAAAADGSLAPGVTGLPRQSPRPAPWLRSIDRPENAIHVSR